MGGDFLLRRRVNIFRDEVKNRHDDKWDRNLAKQNAKFCGEKFGGFATLYGRFRQPICQSRDSRLTAKNEI
jgi:hypothetical protein